MKRRKDGRYVKVLIINGKRIQFFSSKSNERLAEKDISHQILLFTEGKGNVKKYKNISDDWWEEAEPQLAIQSRRTYNQARKRAEERFGNDEISDIVPKQIEKFLQELSNRNYAKKTISNQRMVINLVFQRAIMEGFIEYNACASVKMPKNLKSTKVSSATKIDEDIVKNSASVWLFPYIAIMTGMRKGEILGLLWEDIDFNNKTIKVCRSVAHDGDRPVIKLPKTEAGIRTIPLLPQLETELKKIKGRKNKCFVISDDGKTPLTEKRFTTLMNHFKKETGVTCTAHQLRHSFASTAFEAKLDYKTIQEIMGHKQISTTMDIYTDFRIKSLDEARKALTDEMT